jgi:ABC-type branched-subunit amino acid transport system substrate-binding protein
MAQTTSATYERQRDPLAFPGSEKLVKLIGALYQRPRMGDLPRSLHQANVEWEPGYQDRQERAGRRGLPMVCLVRSDSCEGVLEEFSSRLRSARPSGSVRYAYLPLGEREATDTEGAATVASVEAVRDILWTARTELLRSPRSRGTGLRFGLFTLAVQLMGEQLSGHDSAPERTLLRRLQENGLMVRFRSAIENVGQELVPQNVAWRIPLLLLRLLTMATFRLAVTGRVPGLSGRYRWFLRQPHLAPEMSGSFVRFALRLTDGEWQRESPEFVGRLLVNAFLEDLRRGYRLRPAGFWRRRRMTYPVLLLDHVSTVNGGYRLLKLINDVRNQTGLFDPLLVVSTSNAPPPDATPSEERPNHTATEAGGAYRAWQHELLKDRRARDAAAWYLPIRLAPAGSPDQRRATRKELRSLGDTYVLRRRQSSPPWWATRWMRMGVPLVVLGLVASVVLVRYEDFRASHCGTSSELLTRTGSECVGISDGSFTLFDPADDTIRQVEQVIADQNRRAEKLHEEHGERPYITLVDFEALTSSNDTAEGLTAERESLEGFAVAQLRQLNATATSEPIVRMLIANGGRGMREGVRVAGQLKQLAEQDKSVVGVVGLDMSSEPTKETIRALGNAGIPVVASTLSADDLADQNPIYFQVAPQNRREAAVAAAFALQQPGPRTLRVYYSDDDSDSYSTNLRDDVVRSFKDRGFSVEARAFAPDGGQMAPHSHERYGDRLVGNAASAGRDTCSYDGFVFFAGRGVPDFGDFAGGAAQCASKATVIGDDDVSRYVADQIAREQNRALPYYYLSFANEPATEPQGLARDFYTTLNKTLFPFEQTERGRSFDGHAGLSYDAALVMITATAYLRETSANIPVTPGAVWREITAIHTSRPDARQTNKYIEGVTGTIDYGGDISRNVPEDKPVAVLRVEGGEVDRTPQAFCGLAVDHASDRWCPTDR